MEPVWWLRTGKGRAVLVYPEQSSAFKKKISVRRFKMRPLTLARDFPKELSGVLIHYTPQYHKKLHYKFYPEKNLNDSISDPK